MSEKVARPWIIIKGFILYACLLAGVENSLLITPFFYSPRKRKHQDEKSEKNDNALLTPRLVI